MHLGYRVDKTVNFSVNAEMVKKYKSNTQRNNITSQCPKFLLCLQYLSSKFKVIKKHYLLVVWIVINLLPVDNSIRYKIIFNSVYIILDTNVQRIVEMKK